MPSPKKQNKWKIEYSSKKSEVQVADYFDEHPDQTHVQTAYERDVVENPFFSPVRNRIKKLKGDEYAGVYRYSKSSTRITYYPDKTSQTVKTLAADTATGVSYKKKSSK